MLGRPIIAIILMLSIVTPLSIFGYSTEVYYLGDGKNPYNYIWNQDVLTVRIIVEDGFKIDDDEKELVIHAINMWKWKLGNNFKFKFEEGNYDLYDKICRCTKCNIIAYRKNKNHE